MKTCIFRKFLLIGILTFGVTVSMTGQTLESIRNAVNRGSSGSSSQTQAALNNLDAHRNNRCSSGPVYVVGLYFNGRQVGTAYYCENERSVLNSVSNSLGNPWSLQQIDVINQKSAAEVEADNQAAIERQKEIERQREAERLEKQRKFEADKQNLLADLKGMSQEITKPLELMGGTAQSTNSLELIGMKKEPSNRLELIGTNSPNTTTPVTVSPGQWTMTPDQLERELKMSRTAFDLAMQQMNNYEKNKSALEQEISELTASNKNKEQQVSGLEKQIAILEYQEYLALQFGDGPGLLYRTQREDRLHTQFGLSEKDLTDLQREVLAALRKGVPTLMSKWISLESKVGLKNDTGGSEQHTQSLMEYDASTQGGGMIAGVNKGIDAGETAAVAIVIASYSSPKDEIITSLSKLKERIDANNSLIESTKIQLEGLTVEHVRLQKVFQKYGTNVLQSNDDAKIIQFGNECRAALNVRIEEQN